MNFTIRTLVQQPEYAERIATLHLETEPRFLRHADGYHRNVLVKRFPDFQFLIMSGNDLLGAAVTLPLYWDAAAESLPVTIEEVIIRAVGCCELKKRPTAWLSCR